MSEYNVMQETMGRYSLVDVLRKVRLSNAQTLKMLTRTGLAGPSWDTALTDSVPDLNAAIDKLISGRFRMPELRPEIRSVCEYFGIDIADMERNFMLHLASDNYDGRMLIERANHPALRDIYEKIYRHFTLDGILPLLRTYQKMFAKGLKITRFIHRGFDGIEMLGVTNEGKKVVVKIYIIQNHRTREAVGRAISAVASIAAGDIHFAKHISMPAEMTLYGDTPNIVETTEYAEGPTLHDVAKTGKFGPLLAEERISLALQVLEIADALLRAGFIDEELNVLQNYIVTRDGTVKHVDSGHVMTLEEKACKDSALTPERLTEEWLAGARKNNRTGLSLAVTDVLFGSSWYGMTARQFVDMFTARFGKGYEEDARRLFLVLHNGRRDEDGINKISSELARILRVFNAAGTRPSTAMASKIVGAMSDGGTGSAEPDESDAKPAEKPKQEPTLDMPIDEAVAVAGKIINGKGYVPQAEEVSTLTDTLRDLFIEGFNKNLFNDESLAGFFAERDGVALKHFPIKDWANHKNNDSIDKMVKIICEKKPELSDGLAKICCAIGKLFYDGKAFYGHRTYVGYSRSELFHRLAYEIDLAAHGTEHYDLYYHNEWAWALKHCGRGSEEEARKQLDIIIERSSSKGKLKRLYIIEKAEEDVIKARNQINALAKRKGKPLSEDKFYEQTDAAKALILRVLALDSSAEFSRYPRALSIIGLGYMELARLDKLRMDYLAANFPEKKAEIRELAPGVIGNIRDAINCSSRAFTEAINTDEQASHAQGIRDNIFGDAVRLLSQWHSSVNSAGVAFLDKLGNLDRSIERIKNAVGVTSSVSAQEIQAQLIPITGMTRSQKIMAESFKQELRAVQESDVENAEEFFVRAKDAIAVKIAADPQLERTAANVSAVIKDHVEFYRNKMILDKYSLALIHVYYGVPAEGGKHTAENIMELARVLADGLDEDGWRLRLAKAREFLDLTIENPPAKRIIEIKTPLTLGALASIIGVGPGEIIANLGGKGIVAAAGQYLDEEAVIDILKDRGIGLKKAPKKEKAFITIKPVDLALSIGEGKKGTAGGKFSNFPEAIKNLRRDFDLLVQWDGQCSLTWNYTGMCRQDLEKLESKIAGYVSDVSAYLKALRDKEKAETSSNAASIDTRYREIKEALPKLADMLSGRKERVRSALGGAISGRMALRNKHEGAYEDTQFEHVSNKLVAVEYGLKKLSEILDENNTDYLSPDRFSEQLGELDADLKQLTLFGKAMESMAPLLKIVKDGEEEAVLFRAVFGRVYFIEDIFIPALAEARERLYSAAWEGKSIDQFTDIKSRTEYFSLIRREVQKAVNSFDMSDVLAAGIASELELRSIESEMEGIVQNSMSSIKKYADSNDIIREIFTINPTISPKEADKAKADLAVKALADRLTLKIKILYNIRLASINVGWDDFIRKVKWADSMSPGVFNDENERQLNKMRLELSLLFQEMDSVDLSDGDFLVKMAEGMRKLGEMEDFMERAIDDIWAVWRLKLVEEQASVRKAFITWLKNWIKNIASPEDIESIDRRMASVEEAIKTGIFEEYREHSTALLKMIWKLRDKYSFLAVSKKIRKSITGYLHSANYRAKYLAPAHLAKESARHAIFPVFKDGLLSDIEIVTIDRSPADLNILSTRLSADNSPDPAIVKTISRIKDEIGEAFNSLCFSDSPAYKDIMINPEFFAEFIQSLLFYYGYMAFSVRSLPFERSLPETRSVDAADAFVHAIPLVTKRLQSKTHTAGDDNIGQLLNLKIDALRLLQKKRTLSSDEQNALDIMLETMHKVSFYEYGDWGNRESIKVFLRSALSLLGEVKGASYGMPDDSLLFKAAPAMRLSLTVGEGTSRIYSTYPARPEYRGVYFNPAKLMFEVSESYSGEKSAMLAASLNDAVLYYRGLLRRSGRGDAFSEMLTSLISSGSKVDMAVVDDLPVNSLVSVNTGTVLLDSRFLEFLITHASRSDAARLILGERLAHELGHLVKEKDFVELQNYHDIIVGSEVAQLESDVVALEGIYRSNPGLAGEVDRFVHEIVSPEGKKFSGVFNTARLFTNVHKWILMRRHGQTERMRNSIRVFVIETLKGIELSPFARPFPNKNGLEAESADFDDADFAAKLMSSPRARLDKREKKTLRERRILAPGAAPRSRLLIAREFHVTEERVRQIEKRACKKADYFYKYLNKPMDLEHLDREDFRKLTYFTPRAIRTLEQSGVKTIADLLKMNEDEFMRSEGAGIGTLYEIDAALKENGLSRIKTGSQAVAENIARMPVETLGLSKRTENALKRSLGIMTIGDLLNKTIEDLRYRARGIGEKGIAGIVEKLDDRGLRLRGTPADNDAELPAHYSTIAQAVLNVVRHIHDGTYDAVIMSGYSDELTYKLFETAWKALYPAGDRMPLICRLGGVGNRILYKDDGSGRASHTVEEKENIIKKAIDDSTGEGLNRLRSGKVVYLDDHVAYGDKHGGVMSVLRQELHFNNVGYACYTLDPSNQFPGKENIVAGSSDLPAASLLEALAQKIGFLRDSEAGTSDVLLPEEEQAALEGAARDYVEAGTDIIMQSILKIASQNRPRLDGPISPFDIFDDEKAVSELPFDFIRTFRLSAGPEIAAEPSEEHLVFAEGGWVDEGQSGFMSGEDARKSVEPLEFACGPCTVLVIYDTQTHETFYAHSRYDKLNNLADTLSAAEGYFRGRDGRIVALLSGGSSVTEEQDVQYLKDAKTAELPFVIGRAREALMARALASEFRVVTALPDFTNVGLSVKFYPDRGEFLISENRFSDATPEKVEAYHARLRGMADSARVGKTVTPAVEASDLGSIPLGGSIELPALHKLLLRWKAINGISRDVPMPKVIHKDSDPERDNDYRFELAAPGQETMAGFWFRSPVKDMQPDNPRFVDISPMATAPDVLRSRLMALCQLYFIYNFGIEGIHYSFATDDGLLFIEFMEKRGIFQCEDPIYDEQGELMVGHHIAVKVNINKVREIVEDPAKLEEFMTSTRVTADGAMTPAVPGEKLQANPAEQYDQDDLVKAVLDMLGTVRRGEGRVFFAPVNAGNIAPHSAARGAVKTALERSGFTDVEVVFYDGTRADLMKKHEELLNDPQSLLNKPGALALGYIDAGAIDEAGLKAHNDANSRFKLIREDAPNGIDENDIFIHVAFGLPVLDYVRDPSDNAQKDRLWDIIGKMVKDPQALKNNIGNLFGSGFVLILKKITKIDINKAMREKKYSLEEVLTRA
jgi:hypothetical protein